MKPSPSHLDFLPFNIFLLFLLIMNYLRYGAGTKKSLVSESKDTEGDIENLNQDEIVIIYTDEKEHQSN